jgi:hypothetical protein
MIPEAHEWRTQLPILYIRPASGSSLDLEDKHYKHDYL